MFEIKKEEGLTYEETSKRFKVGMATLFRWKKNIKGKKKWDQPWRKINKEKLQKDRELHPDKYQYERAKDYGVSAWAIGCAIKRLNISVKKKSVSPES